MVHVKMYGQLLAAALCTSYVAGSSFDNDSELTPPFGKRFMSGISNLFSELHNGMMTKFQRFTNTGVHIMVDEGDSHVKECQFVVDFPSDVRATELTVLVDGDKLIVEYTHVSIGEGAVKKTSSKSSRNLPKQCIATSIALNKGYGGWLSNLDEEVPSHHRIRIVFPSFDMIKAGMESGDLPDTALTLVNTTRYVVDVTFDLRQHCLASGFSKEDCRVLGDILPTTMPAVNAEGAFIIPPYKPSINVLPIKFNRSLPKY